MKKKYKIETIEDLCNVATEDNFLRLMTDLGETIGVMIQLKKEIGGVKINSFEWCDDGKVGLKKITATNRETCEVVEIKNIKRRKNLNL